jgi:hypothetical protein
MRPYHTIRRFLLTILCTVVLGGWSLTYGQGSDFHDLSERQRDQWLEEVSGALQDSGLAIESHANLRYLPSRPWDQFQDGIKWRIDEAGYISLANGQRPVGLRLFAQGCFERYGDSFRNWVSVYGNNLKIAHLVAIAVTESGCPAGKILGSDDEQSTGLMQVTGETCQNLLRYLGRPMLSREACLHKMAADPDFSIELAAAYVTQPRIVRQTQLNPPKVAAVYNAGGLYYDRQNEWRLRTTGNHIDRFVASYNAYVAWVRGGRASGTITRGAPGQKVRLAHNPTLPRAVQSRTALEKLRSVAREGDVVFAGDWDTKQGDFYVFVNGQWRGSLAP